MVDPAQTSKFETSPPNLSPSLSSSSSGTPKVTIDNLCTHIAGTTLTSDGIQHNHHPFTQSQDIANPTKVRPPVNHHSPSSPPYLSFAAAPYNDHPMELCESDDIWGLLAVEEEGCQTPRGEEYKIPEPETCPPAPKRNRRHRSERLACLVGKQPEEEEEEFVNSSDVEEALKKMR